MLLGSFANKNHERLLPQPKLKPLTWEEIREIGEWLKGVEDKVKGFEQVVRDQETIVDGMER